MHGSKLEIRIRESNGQESWIPVSYQAEFEGMRTRIHGIKKIPPTSQIWTVTEEPREIATSHVDKEDAMKKNHHELANEANCPPAIVGSSGTAAQPMESNFHAFEPASRAGEATSSTVDKNIKILMQGIDECEALTAAFSEDPPN